MKRALLAIGLATAAVLPSLAAPAPDWLTPLVKVPGGEFVHPGSADALAMHVDDFELERTPVTWAQYKRFAQGTPHWTDLHEAHEKDYPADAPVVYVTWDDAQAYAQAYGRRLPTELEWEYAAASGQRRLSRTYTADEAKELRWYGGAKKEPHPVGRGEANAFGLFDLHGNVWEWIYEVKGGYARQDSRGPEGGTDDLGCGNINTDNGSYAYYLRAAVRAAATKEQAMRFRGFRCAR